MLAKVKNADRQDWYIYLYILCYLVDCGALTAPVNGSVETPSGTGVNATAIYSCNPGFMLCDGCVQTRQCGSDGLWSGSEPTCRCE